MPIFPVFSTFNIQLFLYSKFIQNEPSKTRRKGYSNLTNIFLAFILPPSLTRLAGSSQPPSHPPTKPKDSHSEVWNLRNPFPHQPPRQQADGEPVVITALKMINQSCFTSGWPLRSTKHMTDLPHTLIPFTILPPPPSQPCSQWRLALARRHVNEARARPASRACPLPGLWKSHCRRASGGKADGNLVKNEGRLEGSFHCVFTALQLPLRADRAGLCQSYSSYLLIADKSK